jgi:Tfp pilus assembly protein FimT
MHSLSKLLFPHRKNSLRARLTRGLSTAELVGIIVIVGILGALGGTYITGMITQSKTNTGNQNAQSLTTTLSSAIAGGATTNAGVAAGNVDITTAATAIEALNAGVAIGGVTYQMNPKILSTSEASYTLAGNTFAFTPGSTP